MRTISKSVLQLTGQAIQEEEDDDDQEIIRMLQQANAGIHWELESEIFAGSLFNYKIVLRYVPERKEWSVYLIDADTGEAMVGSDRRSYYEKYSDALDRFNACGRSAVIDMSNTKKIRIVPNTE